MKKITPYLFTAIVTTMPFVAFAQNDIADLLVVVFNIAVTLVGILIVLAILLFFWGLVKFIWNAGDPSKKAEGKQVMTWGIIALFVMVSFIGIIKFLQNSVLPDYRSDFIPLEPGFSATFE